VNIVPGGKIVPKQSVLRESLTQFSAKELYQVQFRLGHQFLIKLYLGVPFPVVGKGLVSHSPHHCHCKFQQVLNGWILQRHHVRSPQVVCPRLPPFIHTSRPRSDLYRLTGSIPLFPLHSGISC